MRGSESGARIGGKDLEVRGGVGPANLEEEAPRFEVSNLGSKRIRLADSSELAEMRSRYPNSDPAMFTSWLTVSACCLCDRGKHADMDGVDFGMTQQCAGDVAKATRMEIGQPTGILPISARSVTLALRSEFIIQPTSSRSCCNRASNRVLRMLCKSFCASSSGALCLQFFESLQSLNDGLSIGEDPFGGYGGIPHNPCDVVSGEPAVRESTRYR